MTPIETRAKRMLDTPLGSRVMLPNFGSRLFELIDKSINEEYRLKFIAYTFEAFFDTLNGRLWDRELEPSQVIFSEINTEQIKAEIILKKGGSISYDN